MPEQEDNRIRELFAQIRRDDAAEAPSFVSTWEAARRQHEQISSAWSWLVPAMVPAAAVALLVFAAALWLWPGPGTSSQDALVNGADPGILDWTAPTAALLDLGGGDSAPGALEQINELPAYGAWSLPSDTLMVQAEELFGQESEL